MKTVKTLSCGIVIVRSDNGTWRYLMLRSYSYYEPGGKGKQQPNETDLQTALRETCEETGLTTDDLDFTWGHVCKDTEPYGAGKVARWFIAQTDKADITLPINPELGKPEHNEAKWMEYEEASGVVCARIQFILDWAKSVIE